MTRFIKTLPLFALLTFVFMTYSNVVDDLDLWWHLKSGQLIYETKTIPGKDDFAYTSYILEEISNIGIKETSSDKLPSEENNRFLSSGFIKRNWLSQIIFYFVYLLGGFTGIGIFKSAVFVLAFLFLYLAMLKRGAGGWSAFIVLCLIAVTGRHFNYTRPQLFSYLLFACVLYTLYDFKKGGKKIYLLPFITLIWANLHGGFVLGVMVIMAFASAELIRYFLHSCLGISEISSLAKNRVRTLCFFCTGSVIATLLSPAGYKTYLFPLILRHSIFIAVEEYHRPMLYEYHAYWLMLFLVIISIVILIIRRRLDITELFICMVVILPSVTGNKYIMYFELGVGVFLSYSMTLAAGWIQERNLIKKAINKLSFSNINMNTAITLLLTAIFVFAVFKISLSGNVLRFDIREKRYPSGAVKFVQDNRLRGKMFNPFNWGGYIVWHLYPDHRVFIYGRSVNETAFYHYNLIAAAAAGNDTASAGPLWKRLLDAYNVNFILTSALSSNGMIIPLVDRLYQDNEWELVYEDGKSMIFLRDSKDNYDFIHRRYLPKEKIYDEIISECMQGIEETPASWGYYETLGFVYIKQNRFNEALNMFEKYLSMNPGNQNIKQNYELLKRYLIKNNG